MTCMSVNKNVDVKQGSSHDSKEVGKNHISTWLELLDGLILLVG